jgi:hypothetical protein
VLGQKGNESQAKKENKKKAPQTTGKLMFHKLGSF